MKLSVHLPQISPHLKGEDVRKVAEAAEEMGFSHLWVGDHFIFPNEGPGSDRAKRRVGFTSPNFLEAMATLTWAASSTRRIGLGTSVTIIPYHNPILLAQEMATLDVLSGGRIVLGAGIGWLEGEFNALGVPFFDRGPRTDEYLEIIKTIWTTPLATFRGSFSNFTNIRIPTMPVQKPHPPIWIGGDSDAAFRRVARTGTGWHPQGHRPSDLKMRVARLREVLEQEQRSLSEITICLCRGFTVTDSPTKNLGERRPLIGTPDEILEDIHDYREAGAHVLRLQFRSLDVNDHLRQMDRLANGVLHRLQ